MPVTYQYLTDRTLAPSSAITNNTLIHIVFTGDTSQNPDGSSYKVKLSQLFSVFASTGATYWTSGSSGNYSVKVKNNSTTDATGDYSVSEGLDTISSGSSSHAEGRSTVAGGSASHAEGYYTTANGSNSHSEGSNTNASGFVSHAEGYYSTATGSHSHAQNYFNISAGDNSHAGGYGSIASGDTSFIHSYNSLVTGSASVVLGGVNITGTTNETVFVPTLSLVTVRDYVNDAAADADTTLASGGLYTTSGSTGRAVYRKP